MEELQFQLGPFNVKARKTEPENNNIPYRFIKTFNRKLNSSQSSVYNLTVNGNGRFYYAPGSDFIAIYFLGEFQIAEELMPFLNELEYALKSVA